MEKKIVGEWEVVRGDIYSTVLLTDNEGVHMNLFQKASGKWFVMLYSGFKKYSSTPSESIINTTILDLHPTTGIPTVATIEVPDWNPLDWDGYNPVGDPIADDRGRIFCSGHVLLSNGDLIVVGGHRVREDNDDRQGYRGLPTTYIFKPDVGPNGTWTIPLNMDSKPAFMKDGRWYPTVTRLSENKVLVVSGWSFTYGRNPGDDPNQPPHSVLNKKIERYPTVDGNWEILNDGTNDVELPFDALYPGAHLLPFSNADLKIQAGEVFYTMPMTRTWRLNVDGFGEPQAYLNQVAPRETLREHCNSIMLTIETMDPNAISMKVLLIGGRNETTALNTTEMINLEVADKLEWQARAPLIIPRYNSNSVILPDKKIFVTGGSQGDNLRENCVSIPEMYDPYAAGGFGSSKMLVGHTYPRMYHSTAILTPDATVLISGGELPNTLGEGIKTLEIYSPPYLFIDAPRPTIISNLTNISYGIPFAINKTGEIVSIMLIRFGCPTHGFDQDQRAIELYFQPFHNTLTITPPENANIAPEGKYMLFILSQEIDILNNVVRMPSKAIILNLS